MLTTLGNVALRRITLSAHTRLTTRHVALAAQSISPHLSPTTSSNRSYATETLTITEKTTIKKPKTTKTTSTTKKPATKSVKKATEVKAPKKAKTVVKKPVKKVKSERTLAVEAASKKAAEKRALVAQALIAEEPDHYMRRSKYTEFMLDQYKDGAALTSTDSTPAGEEMFVEISKRYRSLPESELKEYERRADEAKAQAREEHEKWIQSHTPYRILQANQARKILRRQHREKHEKTQRGGKTRFVYAHLDDPRQPVRPSSPNFIYTKERWDSGDFAGMTAVAAAQIMAKDWRELTHDQREHYNEIYKKRQDKYVEDCLRVYEGKVIPGNKNVTVQES